MSEIGNNTLPESQLQTGENDPSTRTDDQRFEDVEKFGGFQVDNYLHVRKTNPHLKQENLSEEEKVKIENELLDYIKLEWIDDRKQFPSNQEERARTLAKKLLNNLIIRIENFQKEERENNKKGALEERVSQAMQFGFLGSQQRR